MYRKFLFEYPDAYYLRIKETFITNNKVWFDVLSVFSKYILKVVDQCIMHTVLIKTKRNCYL